MFPSVSSDYERDKPIGTATAKLYAAIAGPGIHRATWQLLWAVIVQNYPRHFYHRNENPVRLNYSQYIDWSDCWTTLWNHHRTNRLSKSAFSDF